eukprot:COSAG06_NODE_6987_length_2686_cov_1.354465_5_plen_105_part_00
MAEAPTADGLPEAVPPEEQRGLAKQTSGQLATLWSAEQDDDVGELLQELASLDDEADAADLEAEAMAEAGAEPEPELEPERVYELGPQPELGVPRPHGQTSEGF